MWILWMLQPTKDTWREHYIGKKTNERPLEDETFIESLTVGKETITSEEKKREMREFLGEEFCDNKPKNK